MAGRLLQILGVMAIVGLCGGAAAGFAVLKDRVRVVIQDDRPDSGPDATALLRDDVQVLARDLRALQQAVVENFGQLATGLDGNAEIRHEDVRALRNEVAALGAALQRLQAQLGGAERRFEQGLADLAQASQARQPEAAPPQVATPEENGAGDAAVATPIVVVPEPVAQVATEPPPQVAPARSKGAGFLSFTLPSSGFAFDQPQRYGLLPELCRVGFDAKSTLHDFTGVTSNLTGSFRADWDDPQGLCVGEVVVDARTLKTGVDGRDENMLDHLDTKNHPELRFDLQSFQAKAVDVKARTAEGEVVGRMTIRGKSRELRVPVKVSVDPQQRVVVEGQTRLLLSDYEVPVPNQLGVISMEDEVVVWLALRARAQAESK